jgi:hypothetical protein
MTESRKFVSSPDPVEVESPFGPVLAYVNDMNHIHIDGRNLTVNGVALRVTLNLRVESGTWVAYDESQTNTIYASRKDNWTDASEAQLRKIREVLVPFIGEWADGNIGLRADAQRGRLSNGVRDAASAVAAARKALAQAERALERHEPLEWAWRIGGTDWQLEQAERGGGF